HHRLRDGLPLRSRRHGSYPPHRASVMSSGTDSNSNVAEERNGMSVPLPLAGLTRCLACLLY
ncbi:hypothetical protein, partial [Bosea massiliensis]